jgi:hypothetical protein
MSKAGEDNLPTPLADTPLALLATNPAPQPQPSATPAPVSPYTELLKMMTKGFQQMGDIIDSKLAKALAPVNKRLDNIENGPNTWDPKFRFDDHNILADPTYNPNYREEDVTSEQHAALANQQAAQWFTAEWDNKQNRHAWKSMEDGLETLNKLQYMDEDQFAAAHATQEEIYNMPINYTEEERVMIGREEANALCANIPPPDSPKAPQHISSLIRLSIRKTTMTAPN